MLRRSPRLYLTLLAMTPVGCTIAFPMPSFPKAPFILKGTSVLEERFGGTQCLVWVGDNGVKYHLFQGLELDGATFDRVTTPGVRSRLQLSPREDLQVDCLSGPTVDVDKVLDVFD